MLISKMAEIPVKTWNIIKTLKFTFLGIFIFLILLESVYIAINTKSIEPVITRVGERLAYSTNELNDASLGIIERKSLFVDTGDKYRDIWSFLKVIYSFFVSFYTMFMWLFVFAYLIGLTPFSNKYQTFINYFFAFIIFILLQGIFLLGMSAYHKEIDCFAGCPNGSVETLINPLTAFKNFFIALQYVLEPSFKIINDIKDFNKSNG